MRHGVARNIQYYLDTGNASLIAQAPCRMNPQKQQELNRQIQDLLSSGHINPSTCEWASPVILVEKRDGGYHLCVDYRKLNGVTKMLPILYPELKICMTA